MRTVLVFAGSIGHDNCNVLRCYSVVRVYVKVQCGGLVLRLDKRKVSLFFPNLTAECAILVRSVNFFDVAASCRHSSLSPYIIHRHFLRHRHLHTSAASATTTSTKIVIGWPAVLAEEGWRVAGRSPISFLKGRSHSCLAQTSSSLVFRYLI